jgi:hypothetical protein
MLILLYPLFMVAALLAAYKRQSAALRSFLFIAHCMEVSLSSFYGLEKAGLVVCRVTRFFFHDWVCHRLNLELFYIDSSNRNLLLLLLTRARSHDEHGLSLAANGDTLAIVGSMLFLVSVLEYRQLFVVELVVEEGLLFVVFQLIQVNDSQVFVMIH